MMEEKPNPARIKREFALSTFAIKNRQVVFLLLALILIGGMTAYNTMPRENFPEVVVPTVFVGTVYPGNSPSDIENLITRPIEKEINTINGVNKINSTSIQDYSMIVVEFDFVMEPDKALQEVKDAVDRAKQELPDDLEKEPDIFKMDFSEFIPIMNINLSGDIPIDFLKDYAEYLEDEIEKLPEITDVEIKGARAREVKVAVDIHKMNAVELAFGDIESAIAYENLTISGGDILTDSSRRNIRVAGEFKNAEEIANIVVKNKDQQIVLLKDIADVTFDYKDPESYARSRDLPVVSLDVKKRAGENLINAVDKIAAIVDKAKSEKFPDNLEITFTNDQSRMTRHNVHHLQNEIISGVILVVLILQLFMGLRNAIFVGIAIPLSMLISLMVLNMVGVTLNTMVLFSLVLALGRLVDDGIVVVENTYRLMQRGMPLLQAAKEGVGEVAAAVIASTVTTVIAFVPLLFWNDLPGKFMKYLPITFMIALAASLLVATVINPALTSIFMKVQDEHQKIKLKPLFISIAIIGLFAGIFFLSGMNTPANLLVWVIIILLLNNYVLSPLSFWFQHHILVKIEKGYAALLTYATSGLKPYFFLAGVIALLFASLFFLGKRAPQVTFFPVNDPQYVNIFIELPLGTDIEKTNAVTKQIQQKVYKALEGYSDVVESIITNVGAGTTDPMDGPSVGVTPHKAKITVAFVDFEKRLHVNTGKIMEKLRNEVNVFPGVTMIVDKNRMGPPVGKQVNIEISGEDYEQLVILAEKVRNYINSFDIAGIEELKLDLEKGKPELLVHVDRNAARRFGLSTGQIAMSIRTALFGKEVSQYKLGEDEYPIMVRFNEENRYDLPALLNQEITFRDMNTGRFVTIPISSVATVEYTTSYGSIKRKDLDRVITLYSNVKENEGYNANEVNAKIRKALAGFELPAGFQLKFTGEQEKQAESLAFMMNAFIIALFLVFIVVVTQFKTIHTPLIIMSSVLFSTIGVFLGYAIFDMDIAILMTGIGIISLAGVVVTNAIVLMDCIEFIRERRRAELGLDEAQRLPFSEMVSSIILGGEQRLRPVLLTAITAICGLVPLAVGFNFNYASFLDHWDPEIYIGGDNVIFWGPLAWTIIFGLSFATFLTLVIVPVMYLLFDRFRYWVGDRMATSRTKMFL